MRQRVRLRDHVHPELANRTLTVGVPTDLIRADLYNWPGIMAAILIPSIPLALVYNPFLNRFITGFTGGAFR